MLTKMQTSWSPTARWTRAAVTAESTPPERAQRTRPSPTCPRTRWIESAMKLRGVQSPLQAQTRRTKFSMRALPCGVWTTSGWNWRPMMPASLPMTAMGEFSEWARERKPGGGSATRSPWDIQTGMDEGKPAKKSEGESPW